MAKKVSKSDLNLNVEDVAIIFAFREKSLRLLFSESNPNFVIEFTGYNSREINERLDEQLSEAEKDACLNLLACIEAKLRVDYIIRCEEKHKDPLSRIFRNHFAEKQYKISLEDGILEEWKNLPSTNASIISNIKGAFKYRHWLAHGRYWTYKSTKYDFYGLYNLALQLNSLPLKS